jgi:hypothetical protein
VGLWTPAHKLSTYVDERKQGAKISC